MNQPTKSELLIALKNLADQYENATGNYPARARELLEFAETPTHPPSMKMTMSFLPLVWEYRVELDTEQSPVWKQALDEINEALTEAVFPANIEPENPVPTTTHFEQSEACLREAFDNIRARRQECWKEMSDLQQNSEITAKDVYAHLEGTLEGLVSAKRVLDAYKKTDVALRERLETREKQLERFRDAVLNSRFQLEEGTLDGEQTNAVLGLFDDQFGRCDEH